MRDIIEISNLKKSFGKIKAIDGLSLRVQKGEMFGLVGPDGAGKTTMMRILCALLSYESGVVSVLGKDLKKYGKKLQKKIMYYTI